MMSVLGRSGLKVISLTLFQWGVGREVLLEQLQLNFSF